jgi:hypothetical protein
MRFLFSINILGGFTIILALYSIRALLKPFDYVLTRFGECGEEFV